MIISQYIPVWDHYVVGLKRTKRNMLITSQLKNKEFGDTGWREIGLWGWVKRVLWGKLTFGNLGKYLNIFSKATRIIERLFFGSRIEEVTRNAEPECCVEKGRGRESPALHILSAHRHQSVGPQFPHRPKAGSRLSNLSQDTSSENVFWRTCILST